MPRLKRSVTLLPISTSVAVRAIVERIDNEDDIWYPDSVAIVNVYGNDNDLKSRNRTANAAFRRLDLQHSAETWNLTSMTSPNRKWFGGFTSQVVMQRQNTKWDQAQNRNGNTLFTVRHNARIASTVLATAIPSVCLSVRLSHAGIVSKRLHVARCSLHCQIAKCA